MRSRNRAGAAIRERRVDRIRGDWRAASGDEHAAEQRSSPGGAKLKGRRAMGQTILVTGSTSGFGRLMVETLARQGYSVFAGMRDVAGKNAPAAEALRQVAEREQVVLNVVELDVSALTRRRGGQGRDLGAGSGDELVVGMRVPLQPQ